MGPTPTYPVHLQPAPPAHVAAASIEAWVWLLLALTLVVAAGLVVASRR